MTAKSLANKGRGQRVSPWNGLATTCKVPAMCERDFASRSAESTWAITDLKHRDFKLQNIIALILSLLLCSAREQLKGERIYFSSQLQVMGKPQHSHSQEQRRMNAPMLTACLAFSDLLQARVPNWELCCPPSDRIFPHQIIEDNHLPQTCPLKISSQMILDRAKLTI